ncbi:MAG: hypothetical protein AAF997_08170 [Myxococcota bacterium]
MRLYTRLLVVMAVGLVSPAATSHADDGFAEGQPWGLEVGLGWGRAPNSAYTRTLETFGFERQTAFTFDGFRVSVGVERKIVPHFSLLLQANNLDSRRYERDSGLGPDESFVWNTWAIGVHGRAWLTNQTERFRGYAQLGFGPTVSVTRFNTRLDASDTDFTQFRDSQWYFHVTGLLGIEGMLGKHIGMFLNGGYVYARAPRNQLDERNRGGGGLVLAGLSARFGRSR